MKAGTHVHDKHHGDVAPVLLLMLEQNVLSLTQTTDIFQEISILTEAQELFHRKAKPANPSLIDLLISIQNFHIKI